MRYHKAAAKSEVEADFLIMHQSASLNECVVIKHFGEWFDIRRMTEKEVGDFVDDLGRTRHIDMTAGIVTPH